MRRMHARMMLGMFAITVMALSSLLVAPATRASTDATEMCVTVYESAGGAGDSWTLCNFPNSLYNSSLVGDTTGLNNGCQAPFPFARSDWNDCISSIDYANLPANSRVSFYDNVNYGGDRLACLDLNGSYPGTFDMAWSANDWSSSWRIEGGNC